MSTRKFWLFLVIYIWLLEMLVEVGIMTLLWPYYLLYYNYHPHSYWLYMGPYALLGATFRLYHVFTPRLHPFFCHIWSDLFQKGDVLSMVWQDCHT